MKTISFFISSLVLLVLTFTAQVAWSSESSNTAHRLLLLKSNLENGFGLERMECYPFISKIGFTEDQKPLIANCLQTAIQLKKALEIRGLKDLRVVGFDSRSFRTGGFSSVLIRVSADSNEILKFLESPLTLVEQQKFLNEVNEVKQFILDKINVRDLYCTQRISNNECLTGYKTLAKVLKNTLIKNKQWNEVIITNSYSPLENPSALPLKFDAEEDDMRKQVALRDMMELWDKRQDLYEIIEERYGDWFHKKLKLFKFLCAIDLSDDECLKGAANFYLAAPKLRDRLWSRVVVTRYNTQILDDYNARVRFDLEPDEIIRHFSQKPPRKETQTNQILVEKLEGRTKNNPSGLRVVCDLEGMRSELCVRGFNLFIEFMEKHRRKFVADPRWETLMWIDGNQLERVNFALNSASRPSYLYADANASVKEVEHYLMQFGKIFEEKD